MSARPPSVGRSPPGRLGEYHLIKKIAQGGMGAIYLAKRLGIGGFEKTFVIKCVLESLADDPEVRAMFIDEARLAARLTHPNIAQIYDFGVISGTYYIAMEHIPGEDLRAIIARLRERNAKIPLPVALRIMIDLCGGLEYAHTLTEGGRPLGIIHRDVSPSNIMVSYQGAVKLLDFGIAKATSRISLTRTGGLKGKMAYLSPEQINDTPIDARADIFCLGITLYMLLVHRHPFRRDVEIATMHAILHDELPDPRAYRENLPDDVVAILRRALERDPDRRFSSAGEMAEALQDVLARLAPGIGSPEVASFMFALFGQAGIDERTNVPSLTEVTPTTLLNPRTPLPLVGSDGPERESAPTTLEMPPYVPPPGYTPPVAPAPRRQRSRRAPVLGVITLALAAALAVAARPIKHPPSPAPIAVAPAARPPRPALIVTEPAPPPPPAVAVPPRPHPAPVRLASLDSHQLETVVKAAHPRFAACFRSHTAELPATTGQVTVELAVTSAGRVSSARAVMPDVASAALARCLTGEASRLRFPRHADKEVRFAFPLVYRKGQE